MWSRALAFLREEGNRALLGWIGGGSAAAIGALWTAFVYFHPAEGEKRTPQVGVEAECGAVAETSPGSSGIVAGAIATSAAIIKNGTRATVAISQVFRKILLTSRPDGRMRLCKVLGGNRTETFHVKHF